MSRTRRKSRFRFHRLYPQVSQRFYRYHMRHMRGQDGTNSNPAYGSCTVDRHTGECLPNKWDDIGTKTRLPKKQQREADRIKVALGYKDWQDEQEEDEEDEADSWYEPEDDCEYPSHWYEPEEDYLFSEDLYYWDNYYLDW